MHLIWAGCILMRESIGWDDCISLPHYRESGGAGKGSTVFNLQDNVLMNVMMMLWYSDAGGTNYQNPIDGAEDYDGIMHQAYPWTLSKIFKAVHFFQKV